MRQVELYEVSKTVRTLCGDRISMQTAQCTPMADWKVALPDYSMVVKTHHAQVRHLYQKRMNHKGEVEIANEAFIAVGPQLMELLNAYVEEEKLEALHVASKAVADGCARVDALEAQLATSRRLHSLAVTAGIAGAQRRNLFISMPWYRRVWHAITLKEFT